MKSAALRLMLPLFLAGCSASLKYPEGVPGGPYLALLPKERLAVGCYELNGSLANMPFRIRLDSLPWGVAPVYRPIPNRLDSLWLDRINPQALQVVRRVAVPNHIRRWASYAAWKAGHAVIGDSIQITISGGLGGLEFVLLPTIDSLNGRAHEISDNIGAAEALGLVTGFRVRCS